MQPPEVVTLNVCGALQQCDAWTSHAMGVQRVHETVKTVSRIYGSGLSQGQSSSYVPRLLAGMCTCISLISWHILCQLIHLRPLPAHVLLIVCNAMHVHDVACMRVRDV